MKTCAECNQPTDVTFRSGLVPKEVCESCYGRLMGVALKSATSDRNPVGDAPGITTKTVEAAVRESVL